MKRQTFPLRLVFFLSVFSFLYACTTGPKTESPSEKSKEEVIPQSETETQGDEVLLMEVAPAPAFSSMALGKAMPVPKASFNTERYDAVKEKGFRDPLVSPLSTFSIDVDTASYSNMRRFIGESRWPPPESVRIEEFVNYFEYEFPEPKHDPPFGLHTELAECPWNPENSLLMVSLNTAKPDTSDIPASNLVFLLDVSGSMEYPDKLPLLKKAFRLLVGELREEDRVSIVVYAGASGVILPATPGHRKKEILGALEKLAAGGSTAGGEGLRLAYKIAAQNADGKKNNRILLATDGDFNVGESSDGAMVRLIEENRDRGIFLSVLGFGTGNLNDSMLEKITNAGNGSYHYIDGLLEAKKVLVNQLGGTLATLAKDVKIQIEFNPAKVEAYRLIGYENRELNAEDFEDDQKDAGDLGMGHSVTAFYEIRIADKERPIQGKLKYQERSLKTNGKNREELGWLQLRYKKPDGQKSKLLEQPLNAEISPLAQATENLRFASAVAEYAMILRNSPHKGKANLASVLEKAKSAKGGDPYGYRAEFIRLAETAELIQKTKTELKNGE